MAADCDALRTRIACASAMFTATLNTHTMATAAGRRPAMNSIISAASAASSVSCAPSIHDPSAASIAPTSPPGLPDSASAATTK